MALPTAVTYSTEAEYNLNLSNPANKTVTDGGTLSVLDWTRYALQAEVILDNELFCIDRSCWGSESRIYPLSDGTVIPDNLVLAHIYITERLYELFKLGAGSVGGSAKKEQWKDDGYTVEYNTGNEANLITANIIPNLAKVNIDKTCRVASGYITY